jgi:serine/threonine-protein phosphatase Stp1
VLLISQGRYGVLWAGDSRVYLWRAGELRPLTSDHTLVQEMVDQGLLTAREAQAHPLSHVVSRAVGAADEVAVDQAVGEVQVGDLFLLCSDGLLAVASEDEISEALRLRGPAACDELMALCLARRAPDNVTMVAVACDEATLLSIGGKPR